MNRKVIPLDRDTQFRVISCLEQALWSGTHVADLLNAKGLILSPVAKVEVRYEAMMFLAREMQRWTPAEFLRRVNRTLSGATPEDMYHAILTWVIDHARAAKEEDS